MKGKVKPIKKEKGITLIALIITRIVHVANYQGVYGILYI